MTSIIFDTELTTVDFVSDEMPTMAEEPPKLLSKRDPFFAEPIGEARGREIFEVNTGEYVCHENDLWCNRVNVVPDVGVIFPGDTQPITSLDNKLQGANSDMSMSPVAHHRHDQDHHNYEQSHAANDGMDYDDFAPAETDSFRHEPETVDSIQRAASDREQDAANVEAFTDQTLNPEPSDPFEYALTLPADGFEWSNDQMDKWFDKAEDIMYVALDTGAEHNFNKAAGAEWLTKSNMALKVKNDACKLDPNCTKPYLPNPKYFPHHDYTLADKRMAKALHKCDKTRPYDEQMKEIDEILWRDHRERMRKKQLKWRRANLKKMNQRLKAYYGDKSVYFSSLFS